MVQGPITVAARGSVGARLLGLRVRIPPGTWMPVSCEWCVLSGRGLYDRPIPLPEESCCVYVIECDQAQK